LDLEWVDEKEQRATDYLQGAVNALADDTNREECVDERPLCMAFNVPSRAA